MPIVGHFACDPQIRHSGDAHVIDRRPSMHSYRRTASLRKKDMSRRHPMRNGPYGDSRFDDVLACQTGLEGDRQDESRRLRPDVVKIRLHNNHVCATGGPPSAPFSCTTRSPLRTGGVDALFLFQSNYINRESTSSSFLNLLWPLAPSRLSIKAQGTRRLWTLLVCLGAEPEID